MSRKICIVTSTRADFGPLYSLIKEVDNDKSLDLQLIVTGMHLSPEFGSTYKIVEKEFKIDKKIEILLSSDSGEGVSKTMGLAQISFSEAYSELNPDIVVVLGDRYEILSAVNAAMVLRIPIAHISGGELTYGVIDDSIRHAITKMSHIHFVATKEYKKRVMQLGENKKNIFNFGEVGLDNILNLELLSKDEFEKSINFKLKEKSLLITYHPTTLDNIETIKKNAKIIIESLDELDNTTLIFTKSNSDVGGRIINNLIEEYVLNNPNKAVCFDSLGQIRYLSALKYVDAVFGNTSSGIVEAPSFNIGTINIGSRQDGRIQAKSTINCNENKREIEESLSLLYSKKFQKKLKTVTNPYRKKNTSIKIKEVLKNINLDGIILKKFNDFK